MATRKKTGLWLLNKCPEVFRNKDKLPSKEDALLCYYYYHQTEKETAPVALRKTVDAVKEVWDRASLKTSNHAYCVKKMRNLVDEYNSLKKNKGKSSENARTRETMFLEDVRAEIFDIGSASQEGVGPEDVVFLQEQREDRGSSGIAGIDKIHASKEKKRGKRKVYEEKKRKESRELFKTVPSSAAIGGESESSSSPLSQSASASSEDEFVVCSPKKTPKRDAPQKPPLLKDPNLLATWDRENLSVRAATASYAAALSTVGVDVCDLALSRSTVHRIRRRGREELALELATASSSSPPDRLILHWDGKLLPSISGVHGLQDRVAVIVTGEGHEELLGVPAARDGTGQQMAEAVMDELNTAGLQDKIIGLSFDTTASNTGMFQGACVRIEGELGRDIPWLACRHHVSELILRDVYAETIGPTSGPESLLFKKFRENWEAYDTTKRNSINSFDDLKDLLEDPCIRDLLETAVPFLKRALAEDHPRADYEEILRLSLIFLGEEDPKPLRQPGAIHHARWMTKAIYLLKIGILHDQVQMSRPVGKGVLRACVFVALVYARYWHEAPNPLKAPWNDVQLALILEKYPDKPLAKAASRALQRHLWYLSELTVGLAFFDPRVPDDERERMAQSLSRPATRKGLKRLEGKNLKLDAELHKLVTSKTRTLFDLLGVSPDLTRPVREWELDEDFKLAKERAAALSVVNDSAERGIALIERYNNTITKDEKQKQFLLRIVHRHRQLVGRDTKEDLMKKVF